MKQRVSDTHTFIGLHVIAIALVVTFILGYWNGVDRDVFEILNSWLAMSMGWAEFVALANQRWIDLLSGGFMLASVGFYFVASDGRERVRVCCAIVMMGAAFSAQAAVGGMFPNRESPTLVYEHAVKVTEHFPEIKRTKDVSHSSNPSDHGIGFFTFLMFCFYRFRGKYLWFVVPVIIALGSPRLLVGAHWLTDFICGSLPLALITAAWLFHSKPGKSIESTMARLTITTLEWIGILKKASNQINSV